MNAVFSALSDATRRRILERLMNGTTSVTALAAPFELTLAAVSKHIQVLERARLVRREWQGRVAKISLADEALAEANAWLERMRTFWETRLDALEAVLAESAKIEKISGKSPRATKHSHEKKEKKK